MRKFIIYGILMFCFIFIVIFFVVKCDGGFEKTNLLYLPHPLSWKEMVSYIPIIAIISMIGMLLCLYWTKKKKLW